MRFTRKTRRLRCVFTALTAVAHLVKNKHDKTVLARKLILCFRDRGVITENLSVADVLKVCFVEDRDGQIKAKKRNDKKMNRCGK